MKLANLTTKTKQLAAAAMIAAAAVLAQQFWLLVLLFTDVHVANLTFTN